MGYCLLYEAMLDSIIWARDRYLVPDAGLMVPSHCTLRLAPMSDSDYVDDYVHHWRNVYGFDMTSMHKNIYDDVIIREVHDFAVPADSSPFLQLSLRTTKTEDLNFTKTPFTCVLTADMESLDGFVIWFDTFFMTGTVFEASESSHAGSQVPAEAKAEDWIRSGGNSIAFTTGPHGRRTHWQQGCLLINYKGKHSEALKKGQVISGTIGYEKREDDNRALDINLRWQMEGSTLKGEQSWSMR